MTDSLRSLNGPPPALPVPVGIPERSPFQQTLRDEFGFDSLRPGQEQVIGNVLAGRDTLAIMPTGSGKSLTYQLPAVHLPGLTLVISPLIALMKDQVDSLPVSLRERTRLINSSLPPGAMQEAMAQLRSGNLDLVFVAPERLRDRVLLQALATITVSLVVIDEAHCISLWGQDFRPDYLFIPSAIDIMGGPTVLAVTATATPTMAKQIEIGLGRALNLVTTSLYRPNLFYEVRRFSNRNEKIDAMIALCKRMSGSGIVYVNSRDDTERFAGLLRDNGMEAIHYHAGLDPDTRATQQDRFMHGDARIVVATVAFGMGVDKADVRFILHFNPPDSLEAYAQESGRAGRDGKPARCVLFATTSDKTRLNSFSRRNLLSKDDLRAVYRDLARHANQGWVFIDRSEFDALGGNGIESRVALGLLEQSHLIRRYEDLPRSITMTQTESHTRSVHPLLEELLSSGNVMTIDVLRASRDLDIPPPELVNLLSQSPGWTGVDGRPAACFALLPTSSDSTTSVDTLLNEIERASEARIDAILAYTRGNRCRHQMLAAQFGQTLEPCGSSCDVCTGTHQAGRQARPSNSRQPTATDAMQILDAMRSLPFPMGKTGLVRLLIGSPESRVKEDRSSSFGVLADISKGAVEKIVDQLVDLKLLYRDLDHEYKLISLTAAGKTATLETLSPEFGSSAIPVSKTLDDALDATEQELFKRLSTWRSAEAQRLEVPAFMVASNALLHAIAQSRPTTSRQLLQVSGMGPKKLQQFGDDLLAVVNVDR